MPRIDEGLTNQWTVNPSLDALLDEYLPVVFNAQRKLKKPSRRFIKAYKRTQRQYIQQQRPFRIPFGHYLEEISFHDKYVRVLTHDPTTGTTQEQRAFGGENESIHHHSDTLPLRRGRTKLDCATNDSTRSIPRRNTGTRSNTSAKKHTKHK